MTTSADEPAPGGRRLYRLLGAAGVLLLPLVVIWWPGCRQYPAVTSKESLALVRAVHTACNTRDEARLAQAERRLAELERQGKVAGAEKAGFARIIGMARAGDWDGAERAAFKFAQDQVGQGSGEPGHPDHKPPPQKGKGK